MKEALLYGLKTGVRQWRVAGIVYALQLALALTVGMQVYEVLHASIGNSLNINNLLENYDHTVITDFLKVHGASITPLIGQLRWLLLVWLLFSVFINGGLLYAVLHPGEAAWTSFWKGGAAFFGPFLKLALFFLALALLATLLILVPVGIFLQPALSDLPSEKYVVWTVFGVLVLWAGLLAALFMWSVVTRVAMIRSDERVFGKSLKNGWRLFRRHFRPALGILACFGVLQLALTAVYFGVESLVGTHTPALILLMFIVQQAFVFFRIQLRQMLFAAAARLD